MDRLLCAGQEGAQLWEEAFNNLHDKSQLIQLMLTAEQAARENQDDRGIVALRTFLIHAPDAFFLSSPMRENREWWHAQIEKHKPMCSFVMLNKCIHASLGFFMYREITWRDMKHIINWLTRCFLMTKGRLPASDCFFGHIPDENLANLRSEEDDTCFLQQNTLLLALLDPSFDVNSCTYPPLLLVESPLLLETLLWIRPEIQDRRFYDMTAMEYSLVCAHIPFAEILYRHVGPSFDLSNVRDEKTALWAWEQLRERQIPKRFFKKHALQQCGMSCSTP